MERWLSIVGVLTVISSIMVIVSESIQQGVLWLIAAYIGVSVYMVVKDMGVIGLLLIIIYVGAIAVVLLFIVMLVDSGIKGGEGYIGGYMVVGAIVGIVVMGALVEKRAIGEIKRVILIREKAVEGIGVIMYSSGGYMVIVGGIILLVAMVGAMDIIGVVKGGK